MENAAKGFVSEIMAEVEERTREIEQHLAAELEQHAQRLQAEIAADLQVRLESVEARWRTLETESSSGLRAQVVEANEQANRVDVAAAQAQAAVARVDELCRRVDGKDLDGMSSRLEMQVVTVSEFEGRMQRYESELAEATGDRVVIAELAELSRTLERDCDGARMEFQAHAGRTAEVHGALANTLSELRGVCECQFNALQSRVEAVVTGLKMSNDRAQSDDEIHAQIQALREQLLSLSMRLSDLAINSDQSFLQQLAEEHRSDTERCRLQIRGLEQSVERMALNAKAAIKQLDAKQARSEALVSATQQQLREELAVLIEELNRSRIGVNAQRFPSLQGHYGHFFTSTSAGGVPSLSRLDALSSSTVPSTGPGTPDHRGASSVATTSGTWTPSKLDPKVDLSSAAAAAGSSMEFRHGLSHQSKDGKLDDEACAVM